MTPALSGRTGFKDPFQLVWCLAFGFLVGLTAMAFVLAAGWGMMAAISVYAVAGSLGLLGMAASALLPDRT